MVQVRDPCGNPSQTQAQPNQGLFRDNNQALTSPRGACHGGGRDPAAQQHLGLFFERLQAAKDRRATLGAAGLPALSVARRRQGRLSSKGCTNPKNCAEQVAAFFDVVERIVAQQGLQGGTKKAAENGSLGPRKARDVMSDAHSIRVGKRGRGPHREGFVSG